MKQSIGAQLTAAREAKGLSLGQVVIDINISKEYLIALELEDFDKFPAEAYLLGFLRNYSEYLGLDSDNAVLEYKKIIKNEDPMPLQELVGPPAKSKKRPLGLGILILLILFALIYFVGPSHFFSESKGSKEPSSQELIPPSQIWSLDQDENQLTFKDGDKLSILRNGVKAMFIVEVQSDQIKFLLEDDQQHPPILAFPNKPVVYQFPEGQQQLTINLLSIKNNGALVSIHLMPVADKNSEIFTLPQDLPLVSSEKVILVKDSLKPDRFTFNVLFTAQNLFRYKADESDFIEKVYTKGEQLRVESEKSIFFATSNSGALSIKVAGKILNIGKAGEVSVKLIQWVKNDEGKYDLICIPVK